MTPKEREALITKAYSQIAEAQIALKLAELSLERIAAAEAPQKVDGLPAWTAQSTSVWATREITIGDLKPNIVKGTD